MIITHNFPCKHNTFLRRERERMAGGNLQGSAPSYSSPPCGNGRTPTPTMDLLGMRGERPDPGPAKCAKILQLLERLGHLILQILQHLWITMRVVLKTALSMWLQTDIHEDYGITHFETFHLLDSSPQHKMNKIDVEISMLKQVKLRNIIWNMYNKYMDKMV